MSRLTLAVCWEADSAAAALAAHAECAAGVARVRAAAGALAAWARTVKAPPGLRRAVEAVGHRAQRALAAVLEGETSRWRPPRVYRDPQSSGSRSPPPPAPALRALQAALARSDAGVHALRRCSRLPRHDPRWVAVGDARRRDGAALEAARALARDLAARTVQAAWRRAWYVPGMAVWERRMRREFEELRGLL